MNDNDRNDDHTVDEFGDTSPASLAALSALGALTGDEAARYDTYLESSAEAREDASAFAATADLLGTGVEPPAALKARIMAGIASTPQLPAQSENTPVSPATPLDSAMSEATDAATPVPAPGTVDGAPAATTKATSAAQSARLSKAQQKARSRWYSKPLSTLVAAVALVAVLLGASVLTRTLNNGNGLQEALQLAYIDAQPDAARETIRLTNITDDKQLTATLVWSGNLGQSAFIVDGLASLPDDKTYELWYIGADGPVSAGIFNTQRIGESWRVLDGAMSAGDAVGVTVEPAGGSEQPTTDPLIVIHTT